MKILIVSRTPWNASNSFGNTFSNLFYGMDGVEVFNICCQAGSTENNTVCKTLQLSESSILKGFIGKSVTVSPSQCAPLAPIEKFQTIGKKKRSVWMLVARDMIWMVTRLFWGKAIKKFLKEIKPDVLYLPVYASWYMCDVDRYVIRKTHAPIVCHITDDGYGYSEREKKFCFERLYRVVLRHKWRSIISRCRYLEVFADNMKYEYERVFNVPCFKISKGLLPTEICRPQVKHQSNEVHFVYTGGIGGERYDILIALAKALSCQSLCKCYLDIYTSTPITEDWRSEMETLTTVVFHGSVNGSEIRRIQANADYLVHVEGFSKDAISATRMSFSTKIIDYLSTGNVVLAIGPSEINSISVLKQKGIAVVVDDLSAIQFTVFYLLNGDINTRDIKDRAYTYLTTECDKSVIQAEMLDRLKRVVCDGI